MHVVLGTLLAMTAWQALAVEDETAAALGENALAVGSWRAWLATKGGELPFALELARDDTGEHPRWCATIGNGRERIAVPEMVVDGEAAAVELRFPHYDSVITATVAADGLRLTGTWRKRRSATEWLELPFHAIAGPARRFTDAVLHAPPADADRALLARELSAAITAASGRFAVKFDSSEEPAVGEFAFAAERETNGATTGEAIGDVTATFLTTTGDYRYLAGQLDRGWPGDDGLVGCSDDGLPHHFLRLSCFDGAHAFLFSAELQPDGTLQGGFWSGDRWYEGWTARRDPTAKLPDGFALTKANGAVSFGDLAFPQVFPAIEEALSPATTATTATTDATVRRLDDPAFAGKVRVLQVFGSWCPNCHDACDELVMLHREYGARGLSIVGLAFELTGDRARDSEQVRRYAARHGVTWPLLLAGTSDKQAATASLGLLDRVHAYPTTLFLDATGTVRHVYNGFCGPATGAAYAAQHAEFVRVIEELLQER